MKTTTHFRKFGLALLSAAALACLGACAGGGNAATANSSSHLGSQGDIFGDWDTGTPYHSTSSHTWGVDYD